MKEYVAVQHHYHYVKVKLLSLNTAKACQWIHFLCGILALLWMFHFNNIIITTKIADHYNSDDVTIQRDTI